LVGPSGRRDLGSGGLGVRPVSLARCLLKGLHAEPGLSPRRADPGLRGMNAPVGQPLLKRGLVLPHVVPPTSFNLAGGAFLARRRQFELKKFDQA
jgi:hypothetical protein